MTEWKRILRTAIVGATTLAMLSVVCGLLIGGTVPAADAKVEPPPVTLPSLPAPVTQTLGLAGPILDAECGTIITATALLVPDLGGSLPIDPVPLLAGVVQLCGMIPQPPTTFTCGVDATLSAQVAKLLGSLKIFLAIVNTAAAAPVAEELGVVEQAVPASLGLEAAASMIDAALQCTASSPTTGGATGSGLSPATTIPASGTSGTSGSSATSPSATGPPPEEASAPTVAYTQPGATTPGPTSGPGAGAPTATGSLAGPVSTALVSVTTPRGGTPIGSALVGFLLLVVVAGAVALGLHRAAAARPGGEP